MPLKYQLGVLGWYNFEMLVQTLLKAVVGPGVTSFGGSKDSGRDATFSGAAPFPSQATKWSGKWVFQAKFVDVQGQGERVSGLSLKSAFKKECELILKREDLSKVDNYVLISNVIATSALRKDIDDIFSRATRRVNFAFLDGREVCQFLDIYPAIRRSFPQLIGLSDLNHILNRDLYIRSEAFVQQWQSRLCTFVLTGIYNEALETLQKQHFLVLDGPPEAGKSTIAAALALSHATEGMEVIELLSADDFFRSYDEDRMQISIADDVVGSVKFDPALAEGWSRQLPGIVRKLDREHLLVWTSRKYVLEEALSETRLGEAARDFPRVNEVLVEVGYLTTLEKAQILYNHAKRSDLTSDQKASIRRFARAIAEHDDFTPERIRQLFSNVLVEEYRSGSQKEIFEGMGRFLKNPGKRWHQAYGKLSESERALLLSLLDFRFSAPVTELKRIYKDQTEKSGSSRPAFEACLSRLEHSFLRINRSTFDRKERVSYQHPSLRDLLLGELRGDESARRNYIKMASPYGVAMMCVGLSEAGRARDSVDEDHTIWPRNDDEVDLLIGRTQTVTQGTISFEEWEAILRAADSLIPRQRTRSNVATKLKLVGQELRDFCGSPNGKLINGIAGSFGRNDTFSSNMRFSIEQWYNLFVLYYEIAPYVIPFPRPEFFLEIFHILERSSYQSHVVVKFSLLIGENEPMLKRQIFGRDLVESLQEQLASELEHFPIAWNRRL